ncbi:MAG: hypothetical protein ACR2PA_01110 [Hyphomicrobiaceae bacterium]
MMAALTGLTTPAMALSEAECSELLKQPEVYASGTLFEPYRKALVDSGRAVFKDGRVGRMTVMVGCNAGAFASIAAKTAGVPSPDQAKEAIKLDHKGTVIAN